MNNLSDLLVTVRKDALECRKHIECAEYVIIPHKDYTNNDCKIECKCKKYYATDPESVYLSLLKLTGTEDKEFTE